MRVANTNESLKMEQTLEAEAWEVLTFSFYALHPTALADALAHTTSTGSEDIR